MTAVRVSRSPRTTKSRGYAFIEFATPDTAAVAAETMNKYPLGGRLLVCHVVPLKDQHPLMFVGANREFKKRNIRSVTYSRQHQPIALPDAMARLERLVGREKKQSEKLAALGIDYTLDEDASLQTKAIAFVEKAMKRRRLMEELADMEDDEEDSDDAEEEGSEDEQDEEADDSEEDEEAVAAAAEAEKAALAALNKAFTGAKAAPAVANSRIPVPKAAAAAKPASVAAAPTAAPTKAAAKPVAVVKAAAPKPVPAAKSAPPAKVVTATKPAAKFAAKAK